MSNIVENPCLILGSGQIISIKCVVLVREELVIEIQKIKSEINKKLGGASLGIGFIGSPSWALGASFVTSILESAISNSMKTQATDMLKILEQKINEMNENSKTINVEFIENMHNPIPANWFYVHEYTKKFPVKSNNIKVEFMRRKLNPEKEFSEETFDKSFYIKYIVADASVVNLESNIGNLYVNWQNIAAYRPPIRPN